MPPPQIRVWHVYPEPALLYRHASEGIARLAAEALAARGAFSIVLAGGSTPRSVYERLHEIQTDWEGWHIYFGDERCLPVDHEDRNSRMAYTTWLGRIGIPAAQIHVIPAELGAEEAARQYSETVKPVERFDLVLLGLGEDGHTASLFPGQSYGTESSYPSALAVHGAPKPPSDRVSLSAWRLSRARQVWFLVTGAGKIEAVRSWRNAKNIPAASICPNGGVDIWIDAASFK